MVGPREGVGAKGGLGAPTQGREGPGPFSQLIWQGRGSFPQEKYEHQQKEPVCWEGNLFRKTLPLRWFRDLWVQVSTGWSGHAVHLSFSVAFIHSCLRLSHHHRPLGCPL